MAANQYGIDMADIYRTTAAVKGARTQNKLADLQLSEAQYKVDQRPIEQERQNKLTDLRVKGVAGDVGAQQKFLALDPKNAPAFIKAIGQMDQTKRDATARNVDEIGRASMYVLNGKSPEEQAQRYATMRENLSPEAAAGLPEVYNPQFMELSLAKATTMKQLLQNPTSVSTGTEDVVYKGGREIDRAKKPVKKTAPSGGGKGGSGGIASADENLMYKQSVQLLGGIIDKDGNISALNPEARNTAQSIATNAANIYAGDQTMTRSEAVARSARNFGYDISDMSSQGQAEDPLGIR